VLDFDYNHNKLFHSSAEHAEARLVRRIFALANLTEAYPEVKTGEPERGSEYETLSEVTIYTSLESCAQCAGMMALGNVKAVVYLQTDPGMFRVGNILRNLSENAPPRAPLPISATQIGLGDFQRNLEESYEAWSASLSPTAPYWWSDDVPPLPDMNPFISSFLATSQARKSFELGHQMFLDRVARPPEHPRGRAYDRDRNRLSDSWETKKVFDKALEFFDYARTHGRRGTPHRV
jgi:tRNA(Arg) A34 adenosine deaminase TadA